MDPIAERLALPDGYGKVKTTMAWEAVRERLEQAPRYWLVTTRPDGRAHVVPVDGLWLDDAWYYGGSPETFHQRNLERDPQVVVHLEDTMAAVVMEGSMRRETPPPELARRLTAASKAKYGYALGPDEAYRAGIWTLHPERARAWSAFPADATRFRFG
jgi:hypothetical protein